MALPLLSDVNEVGPRYDCGISSPTFGAAGFWIKPGTFDKKMQTQLRDEVVAAVTASIVDRDIALWKRISQTNWQKGRGEQVFTDGARFRDSLSIDIHTQGQIKLVPKPTAEVNDNLNQYGRGQAYAIPAGGFAGVAFFPWHDGLFLYGTKPAVGAAGAGWGNVALPNAFDHVLWFDTDNFNVWMVVSFSAGVYRTNPLGAGAAPIVPVLYDNGTVAYSMLVYDRLRKNIYAVTGLESASLLSRLDKINAGGAPTVVFDFLHGSVEAVEMYLGNVIVAWNSGIMTQLSFGANPSGAQAMRSTLYKYDGTTVSELAQMPDGIEVVFLKSYLGVLYIIAIETDPYTGTVTGALYSVIGATLSRIGSIDANLMADSGATGDPNGGRGAYIGSPNGMVGVGNYLFIAVTNLLWVYDVVNGGLSRVFGSADFNPGATVGGQITGMLFLNGRLFTYHGGQVPGGVQRLNGNPAIAYTPAYTGEGKLTGSRMDAGLPYVNKFWYGWEVVFKPLLVGDRVAIEYSLDDGATFTACSNSPLIAVGGETRLTFLTQKVNPHALYRAALTPANNDGGPVVVSIAAKYIVVNANASVYQMTIDCFDQVRSRGNKTEDGWSGEDALAFLDSIARQNELVTFYEPDDPLRTPHTCWVMSASRRVQDTSHVFNTKIAEGEVDLVLWETTNA